MSSVWLLDIYDTTNTLYVSRIVLGHLPYMRHSPQLFRGALKIKKNKKVQTLAEPPLPPPSPLHGSVKPIFFHIGGQPPPPFNEVQSLLFFSYRILTPPFLTKGDAWKMY